MLFLFFFACVGVVLWGIEHENIFRTEVGYNHITIGTAPTNSVVAGDVWLLFPQMAEGMR